MKTKVSIWYHNKVELPNMLYATMLCGLSLMYSSHASDTIDVAEVSGGYFLPMYGIIENESVFVDSFSIMPHLVTNQEYAEFVRENRNWLRSQVRPLFADESYLSYWTSDTTFADSLALAPVTNVSWFAAKAYCECQGMRLPTTNEWEFVAMADQHNVDARKDSLYTASILRAYETRGTNLFPVGLHPPNMWGVYDIHTYVWEWTSDFNAIMISGENRDNNNAGLFCGAGSLGATDLMNYAAFMRYAFRNSIEATYTLRGLGFRCVK